jgi:hypothetical protein
VTLRIVVAGPGDAARALLFSLSPDDVETGLDMFTSAPGTASARGSEA